MRSVPENPDIKVVKLPFYDVHAELLRPVSLIPQGANRFQEAQYSFYLSSSQATDIASNRDIQIGAKLDYLYQVRISHWDFLPRKERFVICFKAFIQIELTTANYTDEKIKAFGGKNLWLTLGFEPTTFCLASSCRGITSLSSTRFMLLVTHSFQSN